MTSVICYPPYIFLLKTDYAPEVWDVYRITPSGGMLVGEVNGNWLNLSISTTSSGMIYLEGGAIYAQERYGKAVKKALFKQIPRKDDESLAGLTATTPPLAITSTGKCFSLDNLSRVWSLDDSLMYWFVWPVVQNDYVWVACKKQYDGYIGDAPGVCSHKCRARTACYMLMHVNKAPRVLCYCCDCGWTEDGRPVIASRSSIQADLRTMLFGGHLYDVSILTEDGAEKVPVATVWVEEKDVYSSLKCHLDYGFSPKTSSLLVRRESRVIIYQNGIPAWAIGCSLLTEGSYAEFGYVYIFERYWPEETRSGIKCHCWHVQSGYLWTEMYARYGRDRTIDNAQKGWEEACKRAKEGRDVSDKEISARELSLLCHPDGIKILTRITPAFISLPPIIVQWAWQT